MNTDFYSLWYDPTGNRTRIYRFGLNLRSYLHNTIFFGGYVNLDLKIGKEPKSLSKVDLYDIRFSSALVRFSSFFLLHKKVCSFSCAFLYAHIRTNQTVTYWTKVFRKNFFVKGYSPILKHCSHRLYTKFLNKIFVNILYNSLLSADMDL